MKKSKKKLRITDKDVVVGISFFVAMAFLWFQINNVYTSLDVWLLYGGTMSILIIPNVVYILMHKRKSDNN